MFIHKTPKGLVLHADSLHSTEATEHIDHTFGESIDNYVPRFPLLICDPPYGNIVDEEWDKDAYWTWMQHLHNAAAQDATICMWGGIGKPHNRPFLRFMAEVEHRFPMWIISNLITWKKRRAYGTARNYLFCREECLILTRGNPVFNIPLLDKKRGYKGFNPNYPAKSEYLRRSNVWSDIPELFANKDHPCQKPDRLYQVLIETHSAPADAVYDPCAGSLVTLRAACETGRRYCCVEQNLPYITAGLAYSSDYLKT